MLIPRLVEESGVDEASFTECFESGRVTERVQEDLDNAIATGGRGTPWSILIGPDGATYPINGAVPKQSVEQIIRASQEG